MLQLRYPGIYTQELSSGVRTISGAPTSVALFVGPTKAGIDLLYRSDALTVINVVWGPRMTAMPHNHHMWAVIGMYGGREDNIFWRSLPDDARWPLEAAGGSFVSRPERAASCRS